MTAMSVLRHRARVALGRQARRNRDESMWLAEWLLWAASMRTMRHVEEQRDLFRSALAGKAKRRHPNRPAGRR